MEKRELGSEKNLKHNSFTVSNPGIFTFGEGILYSVSHKRKVKVKNSTIPRKQTNR